MSLLLQVSDAHFGTERPAVVDALQLARTLKPQVLSPGSSSIIQRATRRSSRARHSAAFGPQNDRIVVK